MVIRLLACALAIIVPQAGSGQPTTAGSLPECLPNRLAIQQRLDAVAAAPLEFLPKLELARCYDLSWRMADVEPAILNALSTLRVESRTKETASAAAPAGGPLLAGTDIPIPARIRDAQADYPEKAYVDGVTGLVIVEAVIDKSGKVRDARAALSVPGLDAAAIAAVKKWRFAPAVANGQTVEVMTYLPVRFGATRELWASDLLTVGRFFYSRGLLRHAIAALEAARERAARDSDRYGEIIGLTGTTGARSPTTPPVKIEDVRPIYPRLAQQARVSGQVLLTALIDRFGAVGRIAVLKPVPMLEMAAQEAVSQWKYSPPRVNDQPASIVMTVVVSFSIK